MLSKLYRVHSVRQETPDTLTLEIKPPAGRLCRASCPASSTCYTSSAWAKWPSPSAATRSPTRLHPHRARCGRRLRRRCAAPARRTVGVRGPFGTPLARPPTARQAMWSWLRAASAWRRCAPPSITILTHRDRLRAHCAALRCPDPQRSAVHRLNCPTGGAGFDLELAVTVDTCRRDGWYGNVGAGDDPDPQGTVRPGATRWPSSAALKS